MEHNRKLVSSIFTHSCLRHDLEMIQVKLSWKSVEIQSNPPISVRSIYLPLLSLLGTWLRVQCDSRSRILESTYCRSLRCCRFFLNAFFTRRMRNAARSIDSVGVLLSLFSDFSFLSAFSLFFGGTSSIVLHDPPPSGPRTQAPSEFTFSDFLKTFSVVSAKSTNHQTRTLNNQTAAVVVAALMPALLWHTLFIFII